MIETYVLNELEFKPCQACYACKTKLDHCALKDDLTLVFKALGECDLVVVATPVYFGDISAQTKAFIDRTFSFVKHDFHERPDPVRFAPGKKMSFMERNHTSSYYIKQLKKLIPNITPFTIAFFKGNLDSKRLIIPHRFIMFIAKTFLPEIKEGEYVNPEVVREWSMNLNFK